MTGALAPRDRCARVRAAIALPAPLAHLSHAALCHTQALQSLRALPPPPARTHTPHPDTCELRTWPSGCPLLGPELDAATRVVPCARAVPLIALRFHAPPPFAPFQCSPCVHRLSQAQRSIEGRIQLHWDADGYFNGPATLEGAPLCRVEPRARLARMIWTPIPRLPALT